MTTESVSDIRHVPTAAGGHSIGHALPVGAAGFAWCSLALGLSTIGVLSSAGSSIILAGTFFYGGIVQLAAGAIPLTVQQQTGGRAACPSR